MSEPTLTAALPLACPGCQHALVVDSGAAACPGCGRQWPAADGVVVFGEAHDFPQAFDDSQVQALLTIAEAAGWQAALHDHMRPLDPRRYRHAVDEYRAQWRCLLPAGPRARVLDFRCGWGPVTACLAEDYGLVAAADTQAALARFTALRAREAGASNVTALSLDPRQRLPFLDGYFDVIVLQSALEWGEPGALLREAARVLAPGGWLLVHVPNRLNAARALQSLRGRPAQAPAEGQAFQPQRQTLWGYGRLLARAGLRLTETFAILPSEAEPFYVVPLGQAGALRFFLDSLFDDASLHPALAERGLLAPYQLARILWRGARLAPVEPVLRHLLPGYGLLATRP
jgi:SAM-dependent methyltransferase